MDFKKLRKSLLFPHVAVLLLLTVVSSAFLIFSLVFSESENVISYISYTLSFYTLTAWCCRLPTIIKSIRKFFKENKYAVRWQKDARLRVNVSLTVTFLWDAFYTIFQLALGVKNKSFWFYSLAIYYALLAFMRFFMVKHTLKHKAGEEPLKELKGCRFCGYVLLTMNLALSFIVFFMIYWDRTFVHGEIITIALATYTFYSLTLAIIDVVKYRKYNSPIYSATKAVSLVSVSVSVITLESTMLNTFREEGSLLNEKLMLALSGGAVALFIVAVSIYMIVTSNKQLNLLKLGEEGNATK